MTMYVVALVGQGAPFKHPMPRLVFKQQDEPRIMRKWNCCIHHLAGYCRYGSQCNFKHPLDKDPVIAKLKLEPCQKGVLCPRIDTCLFGHDLSQSQVKRLERTS